MESAGPRTLPLGKRILLSRRALRSVQARLGFLLLASAYALAGHGLVSAAASRVKVPSALPSDGSALLLSPCRLAFLRLVSNRGGGGGGSELRQAFFSDPRAFGCRAGFDSQEERRVLQPQHRGSLRLAGVVGPRRSDFFQNRWNFQRPLGEALGFESSRQLLLPSADLALRSAFPDQLAQELRLALPAPSMRLEMHAHIHRKRNRLKRPYGHRKALLRALATQVRALLDGCGASVFCPALFMLCEFELKVCTQLLRHGSIVTTPTRAKELSRIVDKKVQLAKRGTLHTYRQAEGFFYDTQVTRKLFEEVRQPHVCQEG